eukprot:394604-Prymnesium_polylepis.1
MVGHRCRRVLQGHFYRSTTLYVGARFGTLPFVPAQYGAQFRDRLLGPRDFSLPLTGATAH